MKELFSRLLSRSTGENPENAFQLRVRRLRKAATERHTKGGVSEVQQTKMELIAMIMTMNREDYGLNSSVVAQAMNLTQEDYILAEAAILEPDRLFAALPFWLTLYGFEESNFMRDLEEKAQMAITHRHNR